jgi:hypothetical protein
MVNTPDLILHGKLRMDNLIPLKGITLRRREVSSLTNILSSADVIGFPDLNSKDTACGARSTEFTSTIVETWPVVAGKEVTALWDQWPIAHKGPILQYMAACPSSAYYFYLALLLIPNAVKADA